MHSGAHVAVGYTQKKVLPLCSLWMSFTAPKVWISSIVRRNPLDKFATLQKFQKQEKKTNKYKTVLPSNDFQWLGSTCSAATNCYEALSVQRPHNLCGDWRDSPHRKEGCGGTCPPGCSYRTSTREQEKEQ